MKNIRSLAKITFFFYGNQEENSLRSLYKQLSLLLPTNVIQAQYTSFNTIEKLNHLHYKINGPTIYFANNDANNESNHVIKNFYQIGPLDYKKYLMFQIIELIWGRLFFYELRTIKQLGYIVSAYNTNIDGIMVSYIMLINNSY